MKRIQDASGQAGGSATGKAYVLTATEDSVDAARYHGLDQFQATESLMRA